MLKKQEDYPRRPGAHGTTADATQRSLTRDAEPAIIPTTTKRHAAEQNTDVPTRSASCSHWTTLDTTIYTQMP